MQRNVLLVGYGSIGKKHARSLADLGATSYILTRHPDKVRARFSDDINEFKNKKIDYCIISSATARHLRDLEKCLRALPGLRKILIEKPLESSYHRGERIRDIAKKHNLSVFVAYNLRFAKAFDKIKRFIQRQRKRIKIVEAVAGQDLRQWRDYPDLCDSYSAFREQGGGVDLDLSHEIDYIFWLLGNDFKDKFIYRDKISNLKIHSPDICKLFLDYGNLVVNISLDYIRNPIERYLRIICDNGKNLHYDIAKGYLKINKKMALTNDGINRSYKRMLRAFLDLDKKNTSRLCSLDQALDVLRALGL